MLQKDFHTQAYEHKAGDDVGGALGNGNVAFSQTDTHHRDHEGDYADEEDYPKDCGERFVETQADADGQTIDTGGDSQ